MCFVEENGGSGGRVRTKKQWQKGVLWTHLICIFLCISLLRGSVDYWQIDGLILRIYFPRTDFEKKKKKKRPACYAHI